MCHSATIGKIAPRLVCFTMQLENTRATGGKEHPPASCPARANVLELLRMHAQVARLEHSKQRLLFVFNFRKKRVMRMTWGRGGWLQGGWGGRLTRSGRGRAGGRPWRGSPSARPREAESQRPPAQPPLPTAAAAVMCSPAQPQATPAPMVST